MATLAERAQASAARAFDRLLAGGVARRAVLRYSLVGEYADGVARVDHRDLPCRAMLDSHEGRRAEALLVDRQAEVWLLQGVPRTAEAVWGAFLESDPQPVGSMRQFEPQEAELMVVEAAGGDTTFLWTGAVPLRGDLKAIIAKRDLTVGTGALWSITVSPA